MQKGYLWSKMAPRIACTAPEIQVNPWIPPSEGGGGFKSSDFFYDVYKNKSCKFLVGFQLDSCEINKFICKIFQRRKLRNISFQPFNFTTPFPPLILQTYFPVDNKWKYFYLIYFVQCFNMFVGILIVPCWHSFMVALMMYPIIVMEQITFKLEHTQVISFAISKMYFDAILW